MKDYLTRNAKVEDARLFVLAPKAGEPAASGDKPTDEGSKPAGGGDAKAAPNRADFSIK